MTLPDYYVSAVKYNSDETHLSKMRVHVVDQSNGNFESNKFEEMTRPKVVELIEAGKTFTTVYRNSEGGWTRGAFLRKISVATDYLTTKADKLTRDNLQELPVF